MPYLSGVAKMRPSGKAQHPETAATVVEVSGNKATVDLTDHSKALYDMFQSTCNLKRAKGLKNA